MDELNVLIMNDFGGSEAVTLKGAPRIGDTIPLFYEPWPTVYVVSWLPEKISDRFKGKNIDLLVMVK